MAQPKRGEVWTADLNPPRGHEQAGKRPVLIVSTDRFNSGPAGLVVVAPITSRGKGIPWHVPIQAPEGGLTKASYVLCEMVRSISTERLAKRTGEISDTTMEAVEDRLRILMDL